MLKVGIVSCYFQHNYGSMLQAYATQMALDRLGYDNETIDISGFATEIKKEKIKYFIKASLTSDILLYKFGMVRKVLKKRFSKGKYSACLKNRDEKFKQFSEQYFKLSKRYETKEQLNKECAFNYSTVVVGSDQLWLPGNIAADYYTLNFVPETVNTIAYATSFGQSVLPKDSEKKAKFFLKKIRHISVREETGQRLVKKLINRDVPIVCDPTMLFTGDEWLFIQKNKSFINEPYIFCYFLGSTAMHRNFAKKLSGEIGCKIVALPHLDEYVKSDDGYADEVLYDVDPADFLNLVRNAKFVCTDSFHCSVFSLLYKREFFVFRRYTRKTMQSTNSRLDTLLKITGIKNRLMKGDEDISDCLKNGIDFDAVHENLKLIREEAYKYLKTALEDNMTTDL